MVEPAVGTTRPVPAPLRLRLDRCALTGLDVLIDTIRGSTEYETISCRVAPSIR